MSADLFAEFSNNPAPSPQIQQTTSSTLEGVKRHGSQDLFDFGASSFLPKRRSPSPIEKWPSLQSSFHGMSGSGSGPTSTSKTPLNDDDDDDDDDDGWGDFETAEPSAKPADRKVSGSHGRFAGQVTDISEPQTRPLRVPTIDLMTNTLVDIRESDNDSKTEPRPRSWDDFPLKSHQNDSNVLFDADDFELPSGDYTEEDDNDNDDFGDFATFAPTTSHSKADHPSASKSEPYVDLLSLDDVPSQSYRSKDLDQRPSPPSQLLSGLSFGAVTADSANTPRRLSLQSPKPFTETDVKASSFPKSAAASTASLKKRHENMKPASLEDDDSWGAWDDMPSGGGDVKDGNNSTDAHDSWNWNIGETQATAAILDNNDPPPTNVPPPSVILSMFPDLLSSGNALFKPLSGKNSATKRKILSSPQMINFLQGYILLATTAARVIAGRKQRWHRDKILAKSMSISAAGSKGMKLAGVDKTQSAKEDREAADVVAVWHEQVGRLKSTVMAANAANTIGKTALLKVPELSENLSVHTAKMALTSPKACVICGLKRDERISKVDYEVEDSFGEWWAEHWGHRSCKNFWIEHEPKIRQR